MPRSTADHSDALRLLSLATQEPADGRLTGHYVYEHQELDPM